MRWLYLLATAFLLAGPVSAATIEARLIRATNQAAGTDKTLRDLRSELDRKFGFRRYQLISARQTALPAGERVRLDLGDGFVVYASAASGRNPPAEIEWYAGKVSLVKAQAVRGTLLIRGPAVGEEWIILALAVRD